MSAADGVRGAILKDPNAWKLFLPSGFVHPRDLDPNYVIPNRGPLMTGFTIVNIVLACLVVGPRLYSRVFVVRHFKLDDWLIIPAFFAHIISSIVIIWAVKHAGLGKHVYDSTPREILNWYRVQYASNITMLTDLFITRASILCFITSLAGNAETKSRYTIFGVQVANLLHWPAVMLPAVCMCAPEFRNWDLPQLIITGCMNPVKVVAIQKSALAMGVVGVVLDFAILVIPIRLVWKLRLPVRQRIVVSGLFAIGSLACIASVCKAVYTSRQLSNSTTFDLSWTFVDIFISAEFEQTLGLVTACGPGLKPLFSRIFPVIVSSIRGTSRSKLSGGSPSYSREGKGSAGSKGTIGSGKKGKQYNMDNIGMSTLDSAASIIDAGGDSADSADGRRAEQEGMWQGDIEDGRRVEQEGIWQGDIEDGRGTEQERMWRGDFIMRVEEEGVWRGGNAF